jgi:hypothetical protein
MVISFFKHVSENGSVSAISYWGGGGGGVPIQLVQLRIVLINPVACNFNIVLFVSVF